MSEPAMKSADCIAYLHDASLEGILSAVFLAYVRREDPDDVVPEISFQPRIGQESIVVATDFERAVRVRRGIEKAAGAMAFKAIQRAALCEDVHVGTTIYRFIRYVMDRSKELRAQPVLDELSNPSVSALLSFEKRASNEAELMRQFIRFSHLENGIWYAKCAPNASVIPIVMGYFVDRLNDQPFIIYDERHHIAGVYNGEKWSLVAGDAINVPDACADEGLIREAWKRFYDALSIDARYHPELRRSFMPMRLHSNLTEMQPRNT